MLVSDHERRQTAAEILACAALELFPKASLLGGGPTRSGFGYHFQFETSVDEDLLAQLEQGMKEIVRRGHSIQQREMVRDNAAEMLKARGQPMRAHGVGSLSHSMVDVIQIGDFYDVARGPFLGSTSDLKAFCLTHVEVEGDQTFIGGIAFASSAELKAHVKRQKLAAKRDHRRLGPELDLFVPAGKAGRGLWFWQPKGEIVRQLLVKWWAAEVAKLGAMSVASSGCYRDGFFEDLGVRLDGNAVLALGHALLFGKKIFSYKELPLAYRECGVKIVEPHPDGRGLQKASQQTFAVLSYFCELDQLLNVVISILQFIQETARIFGFEHRVKICGFGPEVRGTRKGWESVQNALTKAAEHLGLDCEAAPSESQALGPSLQVEWVDAIGRHWEGPSIQIDLYLPSELGLRFQGSDGGMDQPIQVWFSVFKSLEGFIALLVEHFEGNFPLWLAPEQVSVLPLTADHRPAAQDLVQRLTAEGIRAKIDDRHETLGGRVRVAQLQKVPYTVVIGDRERDEGKVAVRRLNRPEVRHCNAGEWIAELKQEIRSS